MKKSSKLFEFVDTFESKEVDISELKDKIIDKILINDDIITFICDNIVYLMYNVEDCCVGDINDIIGYEIIRAEKSKSITDEPKIYAFLKDINISTIVKDVYWEYSDVNKYDFKAIDGVLKIII